MPFRRKEELRSSTRFFFSVVAGVFCYAHACIPSWALPETGVPKSPTYVRSMEEGRSLRTAGKLPEAIRAFQRAAGEAKRSGDRKQEAEALVAIGGCQIRRHQYSAGFKTSTRAKELALQAGDLTTAGRSDVSISSIYSQLGDFEGAKARASISRACRPRHR